MSGTHAGEPVSIPLDLIMADPQYQPRGGGLVESHVRLLTESDPTTWPPILVMPSTNGAHILIDGFHRLEAARRLNLPALRCRIVPGAGYPEAVAANIAHGLPLSRSDRKDAARWWAEQEPDLSYREIGRRVGLSDKTVAATLRQGESTKSPRTEPDPIARFVSQIIRADDDGYATARAVRREIECYDDESRTGVAASLADIGGVLVEAATPYAGGRER